MKESEIIIHKLLPFLRAKKRDYEERDLLPTLERLISDLEKTI